MEKDNDVEWMSVGTCECHIQ